MLNRSARVMTTTQFLFIQWAYEKLVIWPQTKSEWLYRVFFVIKNIWPITL